MDMSIIGKIKPDFWNYQDLLSNSSRPVFKFRRMWKFTVLLMAVVSITPLVFMAIIDYHFTNKAVKSDILLRTSRLVSNTRRTISFFLAERKSALDFIVMDNEFDTLNNPEQLKIILKNLKDTFGGFVDIGVINSLGRQGNYVGPYQLMGKDYSNQKWFKLVMERGVYVSDVFLGFRNVPHIVVAIKHETSDNSFYVLRATLDTDRLYSHLSEIQISGGGDFFIINRKGVLQTPSRRYGKVLERISLPIPEYAPKTMVFEEKDEFGRSLIIGYSYIENSPFILMVIKQKHEVMKPWYRNRIDLIGLLIFSIFMILIVILGVATFFVEKIHLADQKQTAIFHKVEYSNKMASLGRLSAGVAHEINNPLAIINEKAGLIKDLFVYKQMYSEDKKLIGLVDSILSSVNRAGTITKRLLNFARHSDLSVETKTINIGETIQEVLGFMGKEAEYRSITVSVNVSDDIPSFENDKGRIQEIFLNLINNSFAAMDDGGYLNIAAKCNEDKSSVSVTVTDDGGGIPEDDMKRIFDPFFSTKTKKGGTGLGLSITYGLIQKIGGKIDVESEVGKGTSFTVTLPLKNL
ncbi:MAG: sensor histidine kinase [Desulfobacterales bacterium]